MPSFRMRRLLRMSGGNVPHRRVRPLAPRLRSCLRPRPHTRRRMRGFSPTARHAQYRLRIHIHFCHHRILAAKGRGPGEVYHGQFADTETCYTAALFAPPAVYPRLHVPLLTTRTLAWAEDGLLGPAFHPARKRKVGDAAAGASVDLANGAVNARHCRTEAAEGEHARGLRGARGHGTSRCRIVEGLSNPDRIHGLRRHVIQTHLRSLRSQRLLTPCSEGIR